MCHVLYSICRMSQIHYVLCLIITMSYIHYVSYSLCLRSHIYNVSWLIFTLSQTTCHIHTTCHIDFVSYYLSYSPCLILLVKFTLSHTTCHIHFVSYYFLYSLYLIILVIFTLSHTTWYIHYVSYYLSNSLCLILVICTDSCYTVTPYYNRPKSDINLTILDKNSMTFHFCGFTVADLRQFEFDF